MPAASSLLSSHVEGVEQTKVTCWLIKIPQARGFPFGRAFAADASSLDWPQCRSHALMVRAARSSIKWAGGTFTNASTGPSVTTSIWPVADCLTICDWRLLTNTPSRYPCQHRADASTAKRRGICSSSALIALLSPVGADDKSLNTLKTRSSRCEDACVFRGSTSGSALSSYLLHCLCGPYQAYCQDPNA